MTAAADGAALTAERKTAILVLLLGTEVAEKLCKHLSKRDVARIAMEVAQIGPIESAQADAVLQEYYLSALQVPEEEGGPDAARRLLAQASISEGIVDQLVGETEESEDALGPLLEAKPEILARALEEEHPQTTALVLLHLPPLAAAKLLRALPESAQTETVLRMATLKQVPGEILGDVAASLQNRLASLKNQEAQDGSQSTLAVLKRMARADVMRVLKEMTEEHPEEADRLRTQLFTFESLIDADQRGMQELLRQLDSAKIALALIGSDDKLVSHFTDNLSERAGSMLREEMEYAGTPDPKEQQTARKEILDVALKLEADDSLSFAEPTEDGDPDADD